MASGFAGTDRPILRVLTFYDPAMREIASDVYQFENETECYVDWTFLYHRDLEDTVIEDLSEYDVVTIDEPWLARSSTELLPNSDWPIANLIPEGENSRWLDQYLSLGQWNSTTFALPAVVNFYLYVYRADIFEDLQLRRAYLSKNERSLDVPHDLESFVEVSQFMHEMEDYTGFVALNYPSEGMVVDILYFLAMAGAPITDAESVLSLDFGNLVRGIEAYKQIHSLGPDASDARSVDDLNDSFITGEVAHILQWTSLLSPLLDPLFSSANASTGFSYLPFESNRATVSGIWLVGLPKEANPEKRSLAVNFVNWFRERVGKGSFNQAEYLRESVTDIKIISRPQVVRYEEFSSLLRLVGTKVLNEEITPLQGALKLREELTQFFKMEDYDY